MALTALVVLVLVDAGFSGFRATTGRSARIEKRRYHLRAVGKGVLTGAALSGLIAILALFLGALTTSPDAYWAAAFDAARSLLLFFAPVAGLALVLLAVRRIPSVDVRSLASTLVFGPLTFVRPLLVVASGVWIILRHARLDVGVLVAVACGGILVLERVLRRFV